MNEQETLSSPLSSARWVAIFSIIGLLLIFVSSLLSETNFVKSIINPLGGAFLVAGLLQFGLMSRLENIEKRKEAKNNAFLNKLEEQRKQILSEIDQAMEFNKAAQMENRFSILDTRFNKIEILLAEIKKDQKKMIHKLKGNG